MTKSLLKIAFATSALLSGPAFAGDSSSSTDSVDSTIAKFLELKSEYRSRVELERKLRASLYEVDQSIKNLAAKVGQADGNLLLYQSKAEKVAKEIIEIEQKIFQHQKRLIQQLQFSRQLKAQQKIKLLFDHQDLQKSQRLLRQFRLLSKKEKQMIERLNQLADESLAKKRDLEKIARKLIDKKRELKTEEEQLRLEQESKLAISQKVRKLKEKFGDELKKLKSQSQVIKQITKQSFFELKGDLNWPLDGKVSLDYGLIKSRPHGLHFANKGLFFASQKQEPVRAVAEGKVLVSAQLPGLGQVVIISHGDEYFSLYAGLKKKRAVQVEKEVTGGEVIGEIAENGHFYGQGLYFELRHYSDSIDPMNWLKPHQVKQAQLTSMEIK